jgi:hypothetical protein
MKKFWKKSSKKVNRRNWKCHNLTTPAQNVEILLQQSLLCLSKQYLFSSFSCTINLNTSKFLSDYWEGVPASTSKDHLSVAHRWLIECFEWQFWSVLVNAEKPLKRSFFLTITIFKLFRHCTLSLNSPRIWEDGLRKYFFLSL